MPVSLQKFSAALPFLFCHLNLPFNKDFALIPEDFENQVQTAFFDAEVQMEKDKCRDLISLDPMSERRK